MNSTELLTYFPLFDKVTQPDILNSSREILMEYSFDEAKVFFYRIFGNVPSSLYLDVEMQDLDKAMAFFKERGFQYLVSANMISNDETMNIFLVHPTQKMILKLYVLNTDISSDTVVEDVTEWGDDEEEFGATAGRGSGEFSIFINFIPTEESVKFISDFRSILTVTKEEKANYVHIFEKTASGQLKLSPYKVKPFSLDITEHYNPEFEKVNESIMEWCSDFKSQNKKLLLLHGDPGTGKTNYIKTLMTENPDTRKIYIPPYYVSSITEPGFFGFIKNYSDSILIIEDAEKILVNRDNDSDNSAMSVLLNLTDGILSDVLNFKIIATFNVNKDKIDPALMRKGRMHLRYEFKKLNKQRTENLYRKLYNEAPEAPEMSLAEIFNSERNGGEKETQRAIGFGA